MTSTCTSHSPKSMYLPSSAIHPSPYLPPSPSPSLPPSEPSLLVALLVRVLSVFREQIPWGLRACNSNRPLFKKHNISRLLFYPQGREARLFLPLTAHLRFTTCSCAADRLVLKRSGREKRAPHCPNQREPERKKVSKIKNEGFRRDVNGFYKRYIRAWWLVHLASLSKQQASRTRPSWVKWLTETQKREQSLGEGGCRN